MRKSSPAGWESSSPFEALRAEGFGECYPGRNFPLHLHPMFPDADILNQGKPTIIAFGQGDVRQGPGSLPVCEAIPGSVLSVPWFKHDRSEIIEQYVEAFRKVVEQVSGLLDVRRTA